MSTSTNNEIVLLKDIKKNYGQGKVVTHALRGVNFKLIEGMLATVLVCLKENNLHPTNYNLFFLQLFLPTL